MIDISILISGVSLLVAIIVAYFNIKSKESHNYREEVSQVTSIVVRLENISEGINEIKSEVKNMKTDVQNLRDRLIKVEQFTELFQHRLDILENLKREVVKNDDKLEG